MRPPSVGIASAKINLALHVTGCRSDGYHLLDSLVVFTKLGDRLTVSRAEAETSFAVSGPFAQGVPTGEENLVLRALSLFDRKLGVDILLEKNLPHPAGIGGGSADAAMALRLISQTLGWQMPTGREILGLGADVPVCLKDFPQRMQGIGDFLSDAPKLPPMWIVLVNPGVPSPTNLVFNGLESKENTPLDPMDWTDADSFWEWLGAQRNDLEKPAMELVPEIAHCLDALRATQGCLLARMSGSGATCFGLFHEAETADLAAAALRETHLKWWAVASEVLDRRRAF